MTTTLSPPSSAEQEGRVLLSNISWRTYEQLLSDTGDQQVRMSYDAGRLEIEMPSVKHEMLKKLVAQLVEMYAMLTGVAFVPVGSATWRKEAKSKGAEGDESYYIANAARVAGRSEFNLEVDPPPDLVIEVELSVSSVDKLAIYSRLGIPEVWRVTDESLDFLGLTSFGTYEPIDRSLSFPNLSRELLTRCVRLRAEREHVEVAQLFMSEVAKQRQV